MQKLCTLQLVVIQSYFTLSSLRWSMLRGFLLSARIFLFFSLSVCFFAPFLPSCWIGELRKEDRKEPHYKLSEISEVFGASVMTYPLLDSTILLSSVCQNLFLLGILILLLTCFLLLLPLLLLLQYRFYNMVIWEKKHTCY